MRPQFNVSAEGQTSRVIINTRQAENSASMRLASVQLKPQTTEQFIIYKDGNGSRLFLSGKKIKS